MRMKRISNVAKDWPKNENRAVSRFKHLLQTRRVSYHPQCWSTDVKELRHAMRICVRERQLRLHGHVARLPAENPAHRILSCRDPSGWSMSRGRPHASWLRQVESYLKDRPKEYRRKVDAATRCSGVCPHT